jgi:DNA-binding NtrC family response regulator
MVKLVHAKRGMRVLVVGLAGQQAGELEAILSGRRPRIVPAENCIEAWKRLHEAAFDAVIVQDTAEGGGWRDLVAEIAAMRLALPVVVASAQPDERLWVDALSAGAYDVIEIPFHPADTSRILERAGRQRNHARRRSPRVDGFGRSAARAVAALSA